MTAFSGCHTTPLMVEAQAVIMLIPPNNAESSKQHLNEQLSERRASGKEVDATADDIVIPDEKVVHCALFKRQGEISLASYPRGKKQDCTATMSIGENRAEDDTFSPVVTRQFEAILQREINVRLWRLVVILAEPVTHADTGPHADSGFISR